MRTRGRGMQKGKEEEETGQKCVCVCEAALTGSVDSPSFGTVEVLSAHNEALIPPISADLESVSLLKMSRCFFYRPMKRGQNRRLLYPEEGRHVL